MTLPPNYRRLHSLNRRRAPAKPVWTQIVIRPSGVWNSRAPFSNYFLANREIGLHFNVLVLSARHLRATLRAQRSDKPVRDTAERDRVAAFALLGYRRSLGRDSTGQRRKPSARDLEVDVGDALQALYQLVVVKVASLLEAFAQCWALNSLLTRLERNEDWSEEEQRLADQFSPILSERIPGWRQIMRTFPTIADELRSLPHIYLDKKTKNEVNAPVSNALNAASVIEFWREYRNLVVHRGGIVSATFHERYACLYEELVEPLGPDTPKLAPLRPLTFSDALARAMATTHYYVACRLGERLAEFSDGRRGHLNAPGPEVKLLGTTLANPKPLLIAGDHEASFKWTADLEFCRRIAWRLRREGANRGLRSPPLPPRLVVKRSQRE
jgi:hypothetical protein